MKNSFLYKIFFSCLVLVQLWQSASGQLVADKFDKLDLSENFDSSSGMWTFMANNENLFLVQDGEYILNRKSTVSPFAVIANSDYNVSAFRMVTSIKIEKSVDDNGSVGVIFMAQENGQGGFLFEINKLKKYRLRQIQGGSYKYLTGDARDGGWTKTDMLNETNVYNLLEIKTSNRNYDISLNNQYLMSFSEISYKSGRFGIIIGPGSKGKVDFLYLFSSSKYEEAETALPDTSSKQNSQNENQNVAKENSPDIIALAESIIKLKTQINKLQSENEDLRKTIEAIKTEDTEAEDEKKNLQATIKQLRTESAQKEITIDSLMKVNREMLRYKELVAGNENSDLIITLSKNLKSEKEKNKLLTDSIAAVKAENQKLKLQSKNTRPGNGTSGNTATNGNSQPPKTDSTQVKKDFVLPDQQ